MAQEIDHNLENQLYDDVCNIIKPVIGLLCM